MNQCFFGFTVASNEFLDLDRGIFFYPDAIFQEQADQRTSYPIDKFCVILIEFGEKQFLYANDIDLMLFDESFEKLIYLLNPHELILSRRMLFLQ